MRRRGTTTCLGSSEQQIRHVGTRNEQHEAYGCLQHPDRLTGAAEDLILQESEVIEAFGALIEAKRAQLLAT